MKVTPVEYTLDALSYRGVRSSGVHLTDCLDYLERKILRKPAQDFSEWESSAELGFAWEDLVIRSLEAQGAVIVKGVEVSSDGIAMSPDIIEIGSGFQSLPAVPLAEGDIRVWDTKLKWASILNAPPEGNWRWQYQLKCYCRAIGASVAVIAPYYINGKWRPPAPIKAFQVWEFTARELDETWRSVVQARGALVREEKSEG